MAYFCLHSGFWLADSSITSQLPPAASILLRAPAVKAAAFTFRLTFRSPSPRILRGPSFVVIILAFINEARVTYVLAGSEASLPTLIVVYCLRLMTVKCFNLGRRRYSGS